MKKADLYFSIFLVALSVFTFVEGLEYPYRAKNGWGAGFYPIWVSVLLFILALVNVIKIAVSIKKTGDDKLFFVDKNHRARVGIFYLSLILYIVALSYIGILLATLIYAILIYRFFDKFTWKATVPPAIGLVAFIYLIFSVVLGLRLPTAFWS
jgi:hypothetical protein